MIPNTAIGEIKLLLVQRIKSHLEQNPGNYNENSVVHRNSDTNSGLAGKGKKLVMIGEI